MKEETVRYMGLILFAGIVQICVYLTVWRIQVWYADRKAAAAKHQTAQ